MSADKNTIERDAQRRIRQLGHQVTGEFSMMSDAVYRCSHCLLTGGWRDGEIAKGYVGAIFERACMVKPITDKED